VKHESFNEERSEEIVIDIRDAHIEKQEIGKYKRDEEMMMI
jgi:hypothetical protein